MRRPLTATLALTVALTATTTLATPAPASAATGSFSVLTYNVAGLPDALSSGNPAENTTPIGQRLPGYDIVTVQEDFNYHAALYAADTHPHRTPTSGGVPFGDGLNTLSDHPFTDFARDRWNSCNGTDCLTPKGFSWQRVRLAEGAWLDLYNLHPNAGTTSADLSARRSNITELSEFIAANSAGHAVIVMGDTNTRYTRAEDNIRELVARNGLTDAWVEAVRGGTPPAAGSPALVCDDANVTNACEVVDKILYRSSRALTLDLTRYSNENAAFRTAGGAMLSDHYPIGAWFSWSTSASIRMSDPWGGPHGASYNDIDRVVPGGRVASVSLRAGNRVDQIGLTTASGGTLTHGGTGGTAASLTLGSGEYLTRATFTQGRHSDTTRIFSAALTTNLGRTLSGGKPTSDSVTYTAPAGWQISGFYGRAGAELDKVGLIYTPAP